MVRKILLSIMLGIVLLSSSLLSVYSPSATERVKITQPVLIDRSEREISNGLVGEVLLVESSLTNNQQTKQPFVYIVQIKDASGFTVSLSWVTGDLLPNQELKSGKSWIPEEAGEYLVETFVWESVEFPVPLAAIKHTEVGILPVLDSLPSIPSPNIVLIYTDDQRWDTIDHMPILKKRLAGEGIEFVNSFVTTSLCCPSRAGLLTGQYTHNHNLWGNLPPDGGATDFKDGSTVAVWLKARGYATNYIGKYMNDYDKINKYIPPGWDDWYVFADPATKYYNYRLNENGVLKSYSNDDRHYSTDLLRDKAIEYIQNADTPLLLGLCYSCSP